LTGLAFVPGGEVGASPDVFFDGGFGFIDACHELHYRLLKSQEKRNGLSLGKEKPPKAEAQHTNKYLLKARNHQVFIFLVQEIQCRCDKGHLGGARYNEIPDHW
jgi:hypothetical protein